MEWKKIVVQEEQYVRRRNVDDSKELNRFIIGIHPGSGA
jgi:hypothetical protein